MTITDSPLAEDRQHKLATAGPPRRQVRRWSYEAKRRIVEETLAPGASVSMVSRRNDVNSNLVFSWRKLYRQGQLGEDAGEPRPRVDFSRHCCLLFMRIT